MSTYAQVHRAANVRRCITAMIMGLYAVLMVFSPLAAHGGGGQPQLSYVPLSRSDGSADGTRGRYLHAWTSPAIPRAGEIHVEVLVTDSAFQPLGGQLFRVQVTSADGKSAPQQTVARPITARNGTPTARHEAAFTLTEAGHYRFDVTVVTRDGQKDFHSFPLEVVQVNRAVKAGLETMLALLAVAGIWLLTQGVRLVSLSVVNHVVE